MTPPKITTVHQRTISGVIEHEHLKRIAARALLEAAGDSTRALTRRGVTCDVRFEHDAEGTRAVVEITEDMSPAAPEDRPAP